MLVALPDGYKPEHVGPGARGEDPDAARGAASLADLGPGPGEARLQTGPHRRRIDVYFCDPHALWQRGSNENTNGRLRQYFPKGTDFATVTVAELDAIADELNDRPRKRLAFAKPTEQIAELLLQ